MQIINLATGEFEYIGNKCRHFTADHGKNRSPSFSGKINPPGPNTTRRAIKVLVNGTAKAGGNLQSLTSYAAYHPTVSSVSSPILYLRRYLGWIVSHLLTMPSDLKIGNSIIILMEESPMTLQMFAKRSV